MSTCVYVGTYSELIQAKYVKRHFCCIVHLLRNKSHQPAVNSLFHVSWSGQVWKTLRYVCESGRTIARLLAACAARLFMVGVDDARLKGR